MWLNKKEKTISSDAPISEQAVPYLEYRKRLSELDFKKLKDVEIAIYCLNVNPTMIKDINVNSERDLTVLKIWIKRDYSNYLLCLKNKVDHIDLLTLYISEKLKKTRDIYDKDMALITSYDKKLVFNYQYETKKGETISYFDKALGVPTSLVARARVKLKLMNAQKLVEKIDIDIKSIDLAIVTGFITSILNTIVRDTILSFINSKNMSFYDLPQHYTVINKGILNNLNECFNECGLAALDFSISDISVSDNTDTLLKNQFYAIAEAERVKAHEQRMESASLDLYERKAAIHNKYPNFPITLTEAEKDMALNRYLTRMGEDTELKADIRDGKLGTRKVDIDGTTTNERKIAPPTFTKQSNGFRIFYAVMVSVLYVIALIMFSAGLGVGLICLGCATFISGITAFACYKRLKYGNKKQQIIDTDYEREGEMYISQEVEDVSSSESDEQVSFEDLD